MKEAKKGIKSSRRLQHFMQQLSIVQKSKKYIERELPRLRDREMTLREKISKEKKAITLVNRARKLR